ncbi:MAG: repeat-containing protein [Acidobacteria bacterium]|nr:repeat-containing protein [Acidobacteriota bacterium]
MHPENSNLIQQLKDPNRVQRISAAGALGESDRINSKSIPPLIKALQDGHSEVRLAALSSLKNIWRMMIGPLGEVFSSGDEIDQVFGPLNRAMRVCLQDENNYVRLTAAEGLRDLYDVDNDVFEVFLEAARDGDESMRRRAALALWLGATDQRAPLPQVATEPGIAVLIHLLQDHSKHVRNYALRAVSSVGTRAKAAAAAVLELLSDEDEEVRYNAALALAGLGPGAQAALPLLIEMITQGDRLKRKAAAFALRRMASEAKAATPTLIKGLQDHEKRVRSRCADTLGLLGQDIEDEALFALIKSENDEDQEVRSAVQRALEAIGKERIAAAHKSAGADQARDTYPLVGFKPEEVPGLRGMLQVPNANMRAYAATALGYLGAREAIPDLMLLLHDEDEDVRRRAADTLQRMGVDEGESGTKG